MNEAFLVFGTTLLTWVACAAFQWGIFSAKLKGIEGRVDKIEENKFVTREEYQARHAELQAQMAEIRRLIVNRNMT